MSMNSLLEKDAISEVNFSFLSSKEKSPCYQFFLDYRYPLAKEVSDKRCALAIVSLTQFVFVSFTYLDIF